jgi:hypothetical protein
MGRAVSRIRPARSGLSSLSHDTGRESVVGREARQLVVSLSGRAGEDEEGMEMVTETRRTALVL